MLSELLSWLVGWLVGLVLIFFTHLSVNFSFVLLGLIYTFNTLFILQTYDIILAFFFTLPVYATIIKVILFLFFKRRLEHCISFCVLLYLYG